MKKILIFASFAPSLLLFRAHLIAELLARGHQVLVLVPEATLNPEFLLEFTQRFSEVEILKVQMSLHGMNPLQDLKLIQKLYVLFKQVRPDIVLSYTIKPVIYGALAAHAAKVPRIFAMITGLGTTFEVRTFKDKLIHCLVKILYRLALVRCHKVIFQNPDDQNLFIQLRLVAASKTTQVNGSGVDLLRFHPCPLPEQLSFIFIGRLVIEKGIGEFIAAARLLHQRYPHLIFRVVGDVFAGHPRSISAHDLQLLKDEPYFDFVGKVLDVMPYIAQSSVMVLPSYREGTPRSVLEAMAMGRPIITTNAPGCRETILEGETGFLVPVQDINKLVARMEYFIKEPGQVAIMGAAARALAIQKFDVHQVNCQMLQAIL